MSTEAPRAVTLDLFCKVVDNFGDIGICWRLARQLQREHGLAVRLWVDDLVSFRRLCPQVDVDASTQYIEQVTVRHWHSQDDCFTPAEVADIVIEFFGCDIPSGYIAAMAELARLDRAPVWLNLEGLSAEEWVEGCHTLPSPHPRLPLTKYFFFPGFTANTGGLLIESGLAADRVDFLADPSRRAEFLSGLGVPYQTTQEFLVSLFCYPQALLADLFAAWQEGAEAVTCLVPEGVAGGAVENFLAQPAVPGATRTRGKLTLR
ncbi:MAG: elongation factor P maturation arginine rhamnosyltransferase EarP, partial [Pseudomonadota bacterium]|nr:elongation factor P maturation arginine rhamnosyltransferase EarP [Pseudomonadota bacterium]